MKHMAAGQFKTHCLSIMDEVQESGEPVLITKHGKPVAKLIPIIQADDAIFGALSAKARIVGDILKSSAPEDWETE